MSDKVFKFILGQKEDGWFIPKLWIDDEEVGFTQGRTESEALDMIADCFKCHLDIGCPWYDRWFAALKRLFDLP